MQYTHTYRPIIEPEQEQWYQSLVNQDRTIYFFVIKKIEENEKIGSCSLHDINWPSRRAELTIKIAHKEERGKGYAKEALSNLLDFGFSDLNLNRIWLGVFTDNTPAINLYKKAGFIEEGIMKKHYFIQGEYKDVLIMARLKK